MSRFLPAIEQLTQTQKDFAINFSTHVPIMKGMERATIGLNSTLKKMNGEKQIRLNEKPIPKEQKSIVDYIG
jgi:hypothetical protein